MKKYFCKVKQLDYGFKIVIYIGMIDGNDTYLLHNNEMKKININKENEPTLTFSNISVSQEPEFLRSLVDGLIDFGIKPTKPIENREQLNAIKYHLEDMRELVKIYTKSTIINVGE